MITMLLMKYLKELAKHPWHLSNLITFIRLNLFVKMDLQTWLNKPFWAQNEEVRKDEQLNLLRNWGLNSGISNIRPNQPEFPMSLFNPIYFGQQWNK